jgi:hypothetical protein
MQSYIAANYMLCRFNESVPVNRLAIISCYRDGINGNNRTFGNLSKKL